MHQVVPLPLILARSSAGLSHSNPVGCLVSGAPETVRLHKGLQQVKPMVVARLPVGIDAPNDLRKEVTGQVPHLHPRQNEKTAVVGDPDRKSSRLNSSHLVISYA